MTSTIEIEGKPYEIAPLMLGAIRTLTRERHFERVLGMVHHAANGTEPTAEEADAYLGSVVKLISCALRPQHPEADEAWVEAHVNRDTAAVIVHGVLVASGFKPTAKESSSPNAGRP